MIHKLCAVLVSLGIAAGLAPAEPAVAEPAQPLRVAALRVGAVDMDASIAFYTEHFGLRVVDRYPIGTAVMMDSDGAFVVITPSTARVHVAPGEANARINFVAPDLGVAVERLGAAGVGIVSREASAVGDFVTVVDPSGNPVNIKGARPGHEVESVRVYNMGISVPDMARARAFYEGVLGFQAFSEDYYPPVVPIRDGDDVPFVLSERGTTTGSSYDAKAEAWAGMAFETHDLRASIARLSEAGVRFVYTEPIDRGSPLWVVGFVDPFGNVHELVEHKGQARPPADVGEGEDDGAIGIDDLAFLRGAWRTTRDNGDVCEETWSGSDGADENASIMGMFRWIDSPQRGGTSKLGEFMTLREENGTLVYRLRHFGLDLKPWEETPIVLHVTEAGGDRILMRPPPDAPEGGSVISIEYRLVDGDLICDAVFNHGGQRDELGFVFERID